MSLIDRGLSGAALVAVIVLLRALLGGRLPRRTFPVLWWVAAMRFLLPFTLPSPLSVHALLRPMEPAAPPTPGPAGLPAQLLPGLSPAPAAEPLPSPFPLWQVLWLTGTLLLALWFLCTALRWRRRFADALPVREGSAARWAAEHPRIALRRSDRITGPLSYGVLHPVILLPKGLEDEDTLRCVLTHEYLHIRRLDGIAKPLFAAVLCLHWWNIAAWTLFLLAGRDLELSCDEAAVRQLGRPAVYARALLRMAEQRSRPLHSHFNQSSIEERIEAIMNLKKLTLPALLCAVLLVTAVTTAFATSAPEPESPGLPAQSAPEDAPKDEEVPLLPVSGGQLSAPYGQRTLYTYPDDDEDTEPVESTVLHSGIDLSAARGTPIMASLSGTVADTGFTASRGNYVLLTHENGYETLYTHCQSVDVSAGDTVTQGDTIAAVGSTGMATGPHLHFELHQNGTPIDPLPLLPDLS